MTKHGLLLAVALAASSSHLPPENGSPPGPTWDTLAGYLEAEAARGFTGAVLVVREGEVILDAGYGLANRELGVPVRPDTVFAVGSQPIDFTHAAILWLAQEGKLALSDPLPEDEWMGLEGFIHTVLFEHYLKDHAAPEDCEFYMCGPPMMIDAVNRMLDDLGVEPESILFDDFGT